jgi:hypothetical protein
LADGYEAIYPPGHTYVHQYDIGVPLSHLLHPFLSVAGYINLISIQPQHSSYNIALGFMVFDIQNFCHQWLSSPSGIVTVLLSRHHVITKELECG